MKGSDENCRRNTFPRLRFYLLFDLEVLANSLSLYVRYVGTMDSIFRVQYTVIVRVRTKGLHLLHTAKFSPSACVISQIKLAKIIFVFCSVVITMWTTSVRLNIPVTAPSRILFGRSVDYTL